LGLQWNGDEVQRRRVKLKKMEIMMRGLRMALGEVKRRGLHYLPPVSIVVFFNFLNKFFYFL